MPRAPLVPVYSHHKASNQAFIRVTEHGRRRTIHLGVHGSPASLEAYRRAVAEIEANGCVSAPRRRTVSIQDLFAAFMRDAAKRYRDESGRPTQEVREYKGITKLVRALYGRLPAAEFGPIAIKTIREQMVKKGWCRKIVNQRINRVRRVFKWGVAEQMVVPGAYQALLAVEGLQRGRTPARETDPVKPVADDVVDATLPHLGRHVRGLVEIQRLTGCRPGDVCRIRRSEIDMTSAVWLYRPAQHKGTWRGKSRVIAIGPKAQEVLTGFFEPIGDDDKPLFSPQREVEEIRAARSAARKTPCYPSHMKRNEQKRKAKPERTPADRYTRRSYYVAVARACERAFPAPAAIAKDPVALKAWKKAHRWHPNQLRHNHGTKVRKQFGLEAAQVVLGHAKADVTQIYAERDLGLAVTVAEKIG